MFHIFKKYLKISKLTKFELLQQTFIEHRHPNLLKFTDTCSLKYWGISLMS